MPNIILTETELQVIHDWERSRAGQFLLEGNQKNVDIVIPIARSKVGGITSRNLDEAVQISLPSLTFMPGHEPAVIKQHIAQKAKDAADKVQAKADADALEAVRKREAKTRAGINSDQRKITTELDRVDRDKAAAAQMVAPTGVNHPAFIQKNAEAKAQFEDLVSRGPLTYRCNREDRAKTEERRGELLSIQVWARQNDKNGKPVLIYSEMVKQAEERIRQFEQQDSRREMS